MTEFTVAPGTGTPEFPIDEVVTLVHDKTGATATGAVVDTGGMEWVDPDTEQEYFLFYVRLAGYEEDFVVHGYPGSWRKQ